MAINGTIWQLSNALVFVVIHMCCIPISDIMLILVVYLHM